MERKELEALIRFHQDGLNQYRQYISPSAQYLEEQTIKALKELEEHMVKITAPSIEEAKAILRKRQAKEE